MLAALIAAALTAAVPGRASVVHNSQSAARFGVTLKDYERYDPWTGYKTDTRLDPMIASDGQVAMLLDQMRDDPSDACARAAARFIRREGTRVVFRPIQDAGGLDTEAAYSHADNEIWINELKPYLRHPLNLRKKLIHESFHRVQALLGLVKDPAQTHDYAHRGAILSYLQDEFPDAGVCRLPEVPEAIRGTVANTVSAEPPRLDRAKIEARLRALGGLPGRMFTFGTPEYRSTIRDADRLAELGRRYGLTLERRRTGDRCASRWGACVVYNDAEHGVSGVFELGPDYPLPNLEQWIRERVGGE